uniref:Cystatin domain-containing protein n=1 Tax=Mesocestoides corti TaxID=53468 RepID=A0A5K3FW73_MESCO
MSELRGLSKPVAPTEDEKKRFKPVIQGYLKQKCGKEPVHVEILLVKSQVRNGKDYSVLVMADYSYYVIQMHETVRDDALTVIFHEVVSLDY